MNTRWKIPILGRLGTPAMHRIAVIFRWKIPVLVLLVWPGLCSAQVNPVQLVVPGGVQRPPETDYGGISLPTERTDSRGIEQARVRIASGDYSQAIRFLDDLLQRDEDSFVWLSSRGEWVGLKKVASQIIRDLPPEGREAYETTFGPVARRELQESLAAGDFLGLRKVAHRYFYTPAGYEAALMLAHHEADRGRHLAAALAYEQLLATQEASARFEPQLSIMAATNWLAADNRQRAKELLEQLTSQRSSIRIAGSAYDYGSPGIDGMQWLLQTVGAPAVQGVAPEQQWLTTRGNPARNGQTDGGLPHLRAAWQVRLLPHPQLEDVHDEMLSMLGRDGRAVLPAATPLTAGNFVITRSAHSLVAVDFETGKRVWQAQPQRVPALERLVNAGGKSEEDANGQQPSRAFAQRIWEDYLYNTISSDGQRVFVIRDLATPWTNDMRRFGIPILHESTAGGSNRLCAYDLATQGKLVWEIDGAARRDDLKGAFFLGAPLAVGKTLYCILEINSERAIYLAALDRTTGTLQWRQRLADLETGILVDTMRRLQASMPSYDAGVLVCPTGAGLVVGIDLAKNSLAWAYRYETNRTPFVDFRRRQSRTAHQTGQWIDSSVTIAGGRVLLTPPESDSLHCLDLVTGKLLWKQDRQDRLYVAGVEDDRVLLVGNHELSAVNLRDGEPAWEQPSRTLPDSATPMGRGFLSNGKYFLPLSTAEVIAIDVESGKIAGRASSRSGQVLGNLVCYRGTVISQTGRFLDRFEQIDVLRAESQARLAKDPDDFESLRTLGEVAYNQGELDQAIDLLERAYSAEPGDLQTREVLGECLLAALDDDFARYRDRLPLLGEIQDASGTGRLALLRLQAQGLLQVEDVLGAFDVCLEMFRMTDHSQTMLPIGRHHQVDLSRWIRVQVAAIWEQADADNRSEISARFEKLQTSLDSTNGGMEQFYDCFGTLAGAEATGMQLARGLVEAGDLLASQQLLMHLATSSDDSLRGEAVARCSQMLHEAQLARFAQTFDQQLAGRLAEVVCLDGKTGQQCLDQWAAQPPRGPLDWPLGQVKVSPAMTQHTNQPRSTRSQLSEVRLERCDDLLGSCNVFLGLHRLVVIRDSYGQEFFRTTLDEDSRLQMYGQVGAYGVSRGNLLILSLGHQIVALNTLASHDRSSDQLLWRRKAASPLDSRLRILDRRSGRDADRPGSFRAPRSQRDGKWIGVLGPVTHDSCVFQEQQRLVCVNPLTGELQWSRTGVPTNCELFGDEQYVFVAPRGGATASVFSTVDGRLLGEVEVPRWQEQVATLGRQVIRWQKRQRADRQMELSSIDAWTGEIAWKHEFERSSQLDVDQGRFVAVVEPSGRCVVIDGATGTRVVDQPVLSTAQTRRLHLFVGIDSFVVATNAPPRQPKIAGLNTVDFDVFDGEVYVFDRRTGQPTFSRPATVQQQPLMLAQPVDLPVIAFAGRVRRRDTSGSPQQLSIMLLEKASGRLLLHEDSQRPSVNHFLLRSSGSAEDAVVVEMVNREIRLDFTAAPRPPEPPAMHQVTAEPKKSAKGLLGIGEKLWGRQ